MRREAEYFLREGWTGQITLKSFQKIALMRKLKLRSARGIYLSQAAGWIFQADSASGHGCSAGWRLTISILAP
jgi:hypothetical protein